MLPKGKISQDKRQPSSAQFCHSPSLLRKLWIFQLDSYRKNSSICWTKVKGEDYWAVKILTKCTMSAAASDKQLGRPATPHCWNDKVGVASASQKEKKKKNLLSKRALFRAFLTGHVLHLPGKMRSIYLKIYYQYASPFQISDWPHRQYCRQEARLSPPVWLARRSGRWPPGIHAWDF